nr:uncharacterized protein LOC113825155 [Penaeus vannamei]
MKFSGTVRQPARLVTCSSRWNQEKARRMMSELPKPRENRLSKEGCDDEEVADFYGRDPNLVKYTDNLEEPLDCRKTKSVLAMFRKMEMQEDDDAKGPRPLKRFTPPPEGEYDDSDDEEYSDEEYSDEEDEEDDDEDEEEESDDDDERPRKPKYKDEILEMLSARKAASLRAKFERWESEVEHNNEYNRNERNEDDEECMPSIDTARNLRAMFENKAQEASRPVVSSQPKLKVTDFVIYIFCAFSVGNYWIALRMKLKKSMTLQKHNLNKNTQVIEDIKATPKNDMVMIARCKDECLIYTMRNDNRTAYGWTQLTTDLSYGIVADCPLPSTSETCHDACNPSHPSSFIQQLCTSLPFFKPHGLPRSETLLQLDSNMQGLHLISNSIKTADIVLLSLIVNHVALQVNTIMTVLSYSKRIKEMTHNEK